MTRRLPRPRARLFGAVVAVGLLLGGCATRSADVKPLPANAADYAGWTCDHIDDELDVVQQRAADVAYAVDEKVGNNIVALGVGVGIFWPAILAMRPDGLEAEELARLKGRYEALRTASKLQSCPPPTPELSPQRAAALPVAVGDRLVYEDRIGGRPPSSEWVLQVAALRRDEIEFRLEAGGRAEARPWRQDLAGNVSAAPDGALHWSHLLHRDLSLGQVVAGEIGIAGDPLARARVRGQVVAIGPQLLAERRFDVVVIDLFGDAQRGDQSTRLDGAIVVDRSSGVLLRLDLRSSMPGFNLQRRLVRIEPRTERAAP
jgi:hypothetical protein